MNRALDCLALLATLCLLAGCPASVNPLYTEDTLVFDEALLGQYDNGRYLVEKGPGRSYLITEKDEQGATKLRAPLHLVKLGDQLFADLELPPGEGKRIVEPAGVKSVHFINRITVDGPKVTFWSFPEEQKLLSAPGVQTVDVVVEDQQGKQDKSPALSLDTKALQAAFAARAAEMTKEETSFTRTGDLPATRAATSDAEQK